MIKAVLIDDHVLVRAGLRQMLQQTGEIKIIGEASSGLEGVRVVRDAKPDIVILDFRLPDITGLEVTTKILTHNAQAKILIVTSAVNDLFPFRLLDAGALGYLTKDSTQEEFIAAIKNVYRGQRVISSAIANKLALTKLDHKKDTTFSTLSDREMEVALLVINDASVKDIAKKLSVSPKTVHSYRSRIFEKLNVKTNVALTLLAIQNNIITLEEAQEKQAK